jgi:hypothetical protein
MIRRRTHSRATKDAEERNDVPQTEEPSHEGAEAEQTNGAVAQPVSRPPTERAEELVDHFTERLSYFAGLVGHKILQWVARAREEVEDMWAEAQHLRRGEQQP